MQLTDISKILNELADKQDAVQVKNIVEAFGSRSYGPLLIIPALLEVTPLGSLPGMRRIHILSATPSAEAELG